ncbi:MAG: phenylalanine--tRNA ligase subunit beta [Clostridia bacterium]|nr:phenylalanine--tRNA ligase subunit beta [Clostridia bacterium]
MYISTNSLKKYIKNSDKIDWSKVWQDFTIRSAEIDGIEEKGKDIQKVVVAKIEKIQEHNSNKDYNVLELNIGNDNIMVVSTAKNLYEGMIVPCALENGSLKGLDKVSKVELGGILSEGVLASERELGISEKHEGVMDLPKSYEIGADIKKYIPIDDLIIEIDNKSLTNRPDMWGHYGIAREVSAITGNELLDLDLTQEGYGEKKLNITIEDKQNCNRYSGLEISNISEKEANIEMKTMLYYCGMRSISLLVDLTNYLMLELGQPMHAFDSGKVKDINIRSTKENINLVTLDGENREINKGTLMICNGNTPIAIAGIMGGMDSEIEDTTSSLILESANFDATCIRKSATALGLRTEASTRYEKSLDPNMTVIAIKRFVKLLKDVDNNISIDSRIEDVYPNVVEKKTIDLSKDILRKYMGIELESNLVKKILNSLDFEVKEEQDKYVVTAPTYRSTKDITSSADIIEEIARLYGYNNLEEKPLKLDLTIMEGDNMYDLEYIIKKSIAKQTGFSEVHSYIWYQTDLLAKYNIKKQNNIALINKSENNLLRDDISLSLFEYCLNNSKYYNEYGIFEIGSTITREKEERVLSIMSVCMSSNLERKYNSIKAIINKEVATLKNQNIEFVAAMSNKEYLNEEYTLEMRVNDKKIGYISVLSKNLSKDCGKKIDIINAEVNINKLMEVAKTEIVYNEPSKYPTTTIDYTIITDKNEDYIKLEKLLNKYTNKYLIEYFIKDIYTDDKKKITIRYVIGSKEKTLTHEEISRVSKEILSNIESNGYKIVK